jgi:hypothetical protein
MSATPMSDADIYAFNPPPVAPAPPAPPPRRIWPWVLAGLFVMVLCGMVAGGFALWALLDSAREGWHVIIGGEPWDPPVGGIVAALGLGGALLAVVVVALVVPLALLAAVLCALLGIGVAMLAAVAALTVMLSPLCLPVLLLWLLLRRKPRAALPPATMGA